MQTRRLALSSVVVLAVFTSGCGGSDCFTLPCPLPMAFQVTVASVSGTAVSNATIDVTGGMQETVPCNGTCMIPGYAGTYQLKVSAPGFATTTLSETVSGHQPARCGCATTDTRQLTVKLSPSA